MKNEELDIIIEKTLKTSEGFSLPADFAQKVTVAVIRQEQWKNNLREYLILTGIIVSLLAVAVGLYNYLEKGFISRLIIFVSQHVFQVIGIAFTLNFILLADWVLLPLLFSRWSRQ